MRISPLSWLQEIITISNAERLTYGNMHDVLTGLFNRSACDFMRHDLDMSHNALLVVDVDKFKAINDTYGHDIGDIVLKRVAFADRENPEGDIFKDADTALYQMKQSGRCGCHIY